MKIAFLCFYKGKVSRGVETFVDELATRLSRVNEVVVYQLGVENRANYRIIPINISMNWQKTNSQSILNRFFLDYFSLKIALFTLKSVKSLLHEDFDVIIPTNGGWQTLICRVICFLKGKKMVVSGQSGPGWDERWNLFCHPDLFVALSTRDYNWALKNSLGVKVTKIPNGVDLTKFDPKISGAEIPLKRPIILCASALTPDKRTELAIQAVSKLGNVSLLILGQGDYSQKQNVEKLGNDLLKDRFLLMQVPHKDIAKYFKSCDLLTFPSKTHESFGIVIVEAMAVNLPVVVTDDEVRREIVDNAGFFIDPQDIGKYAYKLKDALEKKWGDIPRKQAEKFSWDKIAQEYKSAFKSIC